MYVFLNGLSLKKNSNTVLLRSDESREWCPYVTDPALRRVTQHHYMFWSRRQPTGSSLSSSLFFFFSRCVLFQGLPHRQRQAEPHSDIANYTSGREDSNTTFSTYIIGDIYIHFWSFQIRHHQTCYTVSLSLNCHYFLCKCLFSPACQVFEAKYSKRDAHIQTRTHTCGTHPHTYCIIHTKRSTLA